MNSITSDAVDAVRAAHVRRTVGVLGGGQLGRMMAEAAHRLGIKMIVLDPQPDSPAGQIAHDQIVGAFTDVSCIRSLASKVDVLTCEIEHVNTEALAHIEQEFKHVKVQPSSSTIALIQDKYKQKLHLLQRDVAVGHFRLTDSVAAIEEAGKKYGYPLMLKSRRNAYDGRGNAVVEGPDNISRALAALKADASKGVLDLYAEKMIDFSQELAVMVAKGAHETLAYACVSTTQKDNICHTVTAPANVSFAVARAAQELALAAVNTFDGLGMYGVEMFLCRDNSILINEIAPRPHNSGHYTIEACDTSQFEQHLRCVLDLPLGSTEMSRGAAMMINVLGTGDTDKDVELSWLPCRAAMLVPGCHVHWYAKQGVRKGRKLGHVTIVADNPQQLRRRHSSFASLRDSLSQGTGVPLSLDDNTSPVVGVIMGSDSDLRVMKAASEILTIFQVPHECRIISAHRTPAAMLAYAQKARSRGLKVIIAGAGGAAHLPGMVAAATSLPVIGVPVSSTTSTGLNGVDALYSIVQMPRGVPVATVAIDNATNAALLALRMLSITEIRLAQQMEQYQYQMETEVIDKDATLRETGAEHYAAPPKREEASKPKRNAGLGEESEKNQTKAVAENHQTDKQ